ncbi:MAG: hypothetical protein GY754_43705 [bacterium]|nr:hypothetical protein [bacterium]
MKKKSKFWFGSEDSIDEDVVYRFDEMPVAVECKEFCDGKEENRNIIVIKEGIVQETYKGLPDEMNNALFYTYQHHKQEDELPVTRAVNRIVPLKVVRAIRSLLSMLSSGPQRAEIKAALKSGNFMQRKEMLAGLDLSPIAGDREALKVAAFQFGQTQALVEGVELYTKSGISERYPELAGYLARNDNDTGKLARFKEQFLESIAGVYTRQKGTLNLFCYENGPAMKDWNWYARQSRGMVIDMKKERCVYYPADKFFRIGEMPESNLENLPSVEGVEIVEKVDGSMISCFKYNNNIEFHCKGNFDVEQSIKAAQISKKYDLSALDFDRYYYVFEVIYPENRYPNGMCVSDYGRDEKLVLTCMRDRMTNEMISYEQVIQEAEKCSMPFPEVKKGTLEDVLKETGQPETKLGEEGYVARFSNGLYVKIKYPAYMEVLRLANDLRSNRFIKRYRTFSPEEQQACLEILPEGFRAVALSHLEKLNAIGREIIESFEAIIKEKEKEFPQYVLDCVPQEFQKTLFLHWRKKNTTEEVEGLAAKIYYGKISLLNINL